VESRERRHLAQPRHRLDQDFLPLAVEIGRDGRNHGIEAIDAEIVPTLGHSIFRFNEQFLDKVIMPIAKDYTRLRANGSLHHAQAPAVLDNSRTLPQACSARRARNSPRFTGPG
jgi:hypothetical protein